MRSAVTSRRRAAVDDDAVGEDGLGQGFYIVRENVIAAIEGGAAWLARESPSEPRGWRRDKRHCCCGCGGSGRQYTLDNLGHINHFDGLCRSDNFIRREDGCDGFDRMANLLLLQHLNLIRNARIARRTRSRKRSSWASGSGRCLHIQSGSGGQHMKGRGSG